MIFNELKQKIECSKIFYFLKGECGRNRSASNCDSVLFIVNFFIKLLTTI